MRFGFGERRINTVKLRLTATTVIRPRRLVVTATPFSLGETDTHVLIYIYIYIYIYKTLIVRSPVNTANGHVTFKIPNSSIF